MGLLKRRKLQQRIYKVASIFEAIARQMMTEARRAEREAERKFERVKALYRKGLTKEATLTARKVVAYRRKAIKLDNLADNIHDIAFTLMSMAPMAQMRKALEDSIKVARSLRGLIGPSILSELMSELRPLLNELGITMDRASELGGEMDVTNVLEPDVSELDEEVKEVLERAALEVGAELPVPEVAEIEERERRIRELRGKGEGE